MLYRYLVKNPACVFALIAITLLSGCANYQLGDSAPLPFRTLYILPAANDSFAPLAVSTVSSEIREAFIRDGRVKLIAKEENADAILTIRLTEYERSAVTRDTDDTFRARDFNIRFSASFPFITKHPVMIFFVIARLLPVQMPMWAIHTAEQKPLVSTTVRQRT